MRCAVLAVSIFFIYGFLSALPSSAQIKINEFSSDGSDDWIELYNQSENEIDVTGYILRDNTVSNKKDLSGIITAKGFLVIDWNKLNEESDSIRILEGESVHDEIVYGTEVIPYPESNTSVGRLSDGDGDWAVFEFSTKGLSNGGAQIYSSPTPTPSKTPTPTHTPKPTKTPVPTKTPKPEPTHTPAKSEIASEKDVLYAQITKTNGIKNSSTDSSQISKQSSEIKLSIDEPSPIHKEAEAAEVKGTSERNLPVIWIGIGVFFLIISSGLLIVRKHTLFS